MCGFVGMVSHQQVGPGLMMALQAIQHRGQDAAGIATRDGYQLHLIKGLGLISQAVPPARLGELTGTAGIAHVRYPTAGSHSTHEDAQPFFTRRPGVLLAHNGNVVNVPELRSGLQSQGLTVLSQCDAEPILLVLARALTERRPYGHTADDVVQAVREVYDRVRGAYSVVAVLEVDGEETLVAFRDPMGIRPGVYGRSAAGGWMAASESVALDALEFEKVDDIPVGEVVLLRAGEAPIQIPLQPSAGRPCAFERIYFARPDAMMEDGRVNRNRWRMGRQLAQEWRAKGLEADVVVAVPDTSRPAAMAMAEELGIANREGFIKNRYSGRTFIMPDQATREAALRLKLNPVREIFEGKRVLLVDDSVVRGSTMGRIVAMLRKLAPAELHLAIFSPPVRSPCFYGIDMPTTDELIAAQIPRDRLESELAARWGADSLTYLSVEGMREMLGERACAACFTGDYPIALTDDERAAITGERDAREAARKAK